MKLYPLLLITLTLLSINSANADLYLELALEGGGDELIETNTTESISAGGGIKFALGVQNPINYDGSADLRLAVGYLSDNIVGHNGEAEFNTITFDAMLISRAGPHSLGVGGTVHLAPEYSDSVDGFYPESIQYDNAVGFVFQYGYHFFPGMELGLRYTDLTYQAGPIQHDAGSIGVYISNGF